MRSAQYLISSAAIFCFCACTHNDGGVAELYGQWQLETQEAQGDAEITPLPEGSKVYWRFQSSTIGMSLVFDNHGSDNRFGNYRVADNTLYLNFPDEGRFGEPLLGLPRESELQIVSHTAKSMTLIYSPSSNGQIVYKFRKW